MMLHPNTFANLSDLYQDIPDILNDPDLEACAFAADMSKADLANLLIKRLAITKGILEQNVKIKLKRVDSNNNTNYVEIELKHPVTKQPLKYKDFIRDRSGPMFGGYLDDTIGEQYLVDNQTDFQMKRNRISTERYNQTIEKYGNTIQNLEKVKLATKVFHRPHRTQRKLSDFDLCGSNMFVFRDAVMNAIEENTGIALKENHRTLGLAISDALWVAGGDVDLNLVEQAIIDPNIHYLKETDKLMRQAENYSHILMEGPGKAMFETGVSMPNELARRTCAVPDKTYGLGIEFRGPEVRDDPDHPEVLRLTSELYLEYENSAKSKEDFDRFARFFPEQSEREVQDILKHHGLYELGDIICETGSSYQNVFTTEQNIQSAISRIVEVTGKAAWKGICKANGIVGRSPSENEMINIFNFLQNMKTFAEIKSLFKEIEELYKRNDQFIKSSFLFEECANKEGQSQIFKIDNQRKLIGNISDIEPFILGAVNKSKSNRGEESNLALAHLELTALSLMVSSPRWGINAKNYKTIGEGETVEPKEYVKSLNSRSYAFDSKRPGPRTLDDVGWNNITVEQAQNRLNNYSLSMNTICESVRVQEQYFQYVGELKEALIEREHCRHLLAFDKSNINNLENMHLASVKVEKLRNKMEVELMRIVKNDFPNLYSQIHSLCTSPEEQNLVFATLARQVQRSVDFGIGREARLKKPINLTHRVAAVTPIIRYQDEILNAAKSLAEAFEKMNESLRESANTVKPLSSTQARNSDTRRKSVSFRIPEIEQAQRSSPKVAIENKYIRFNQ